MTGALGFNPRAALARQDAPRPEGGDVSKLAGLATAPPPNTHSAPSPAGPEVSRLATLATAPPPNTHSVGCPDEGAELPGEHDAVALDPDLAEELAVMRQHYAAPPSPRPYRPTDPDDYRDGLLIAALMRPPSWAGPTPPPKGAWCGCCGHTHRSGGRWWRPRHPRTDGTGLAPGWRCWTCHPPPDPSEVEEVRT
jgi:hypothetical protein